MVKKTTYKMAFKRRRQSLTDYARRLAMVKSGLPRLVARKTNGAIVAQFAIVGEKGDVVLASANSKELAAYGWFGNSNLPSAYLTGFLCGTRAKGKVRKFILDMGLAHSSKSNFSYAALKGAVDSGLESNVGEGIIDEARLSGQHISEYAKALKAGSQEKFSRQFSDYVRAGRDPAELPKLFAGAKEKISQNPNSSKKAKKGNSGE